MKLMILAKIRVIYTYVPPAHAQRVYLHSYYLPRDYWPLSVSLINFTIFTPSTPPPPLHTTLNYRGSRCLTLLTSGQPMYPNVGGEIKGGIAVKVASCHKRDAATHTARLQNLNPSLLRSLQYPSCDH